MATWPIITPPPCNIVLATTVVAPGTSDAVDRGDLVGRPALITITTTGTSTPSVTCAIQCSADGANWFAMTYADVLTPTTFVATTFALTNTTQASVYKILATTVPWRFVNIAFSAFTTMTVNTAFITLF